MIGLSYSAVVFIYLLAIVLLVLWVVLPFTVFAIKGQLEKLVEAQGKTNKLLKEMLEHQQQIPKKGGHTENTGDSGLQNSELKDKIDKLL